MFPEETARHIEANVDVGHAFTEDVYVSCGFKQLCLADYCACRGIPSVFGGRIYSEDSIRLRTLHIERIEFLEYMSTDSLWRPRRHDIHPLSPTRITVSSKGSVSENRGVRQWMKAKRKDPAYSGGGPFRCSSSLSGPSPASSNKTNSRVSQLDRHTTARIRACQDHCPVVCGQESERRGRGSNPREL